MRVLGVETSCDETAVAVIETLSDGVRVLSNVVASQVAKHAPFGGVVPDIAARLHAEAIGVVAQQALAEAKLTVRDVEAVAVTTRPGLVNCLMVGLGWAQAFAVGRRLPLISVDHLEAHVYSAMLPEPGKGTAWALRPPFVCLLVSGGHTAIYRYDGPGEIKRLGRTVDDAAGEAFDKVAALLGLPYPGGPSVQKAARAGNPQSVELKKAVIDGRPYDFSFSGMKTAVLYHTRGRNAPREAPLLPGIKVEDVAASFQEAACSVLAERAVKAAIDEGVPALAIGGGVAANERLRALVKELGRKRGLEIVVPAFAYCTDNAAMVAALGAAYLEKGARTSIAVEASARSEVGA
ncbi:MAG TPA: tRNA (adenosine(37)-N6)-threonylcarbamoyltransferase complex transferase subunit TsaD [Planctomycetota bacterium]|nr:tRNA (adenosine(37)-N6)-threonylcarbamoyltransferase complex transferase subunit TsaD [Planctomycetota bacterium]